MPLEPVLALGHGQLVNMEDEPVAEDASLEPDTFLEHCTTSRYGGNCRLVNQLKEGFILFVGSTRSARYSPSHRRNRRSAETIQHEEDKRGYQHYNLSNIRTCIDARDHGRCGR